MPKTFTITFNSDDALLLRSELKLRDGDPWPDTGEKFFKAREMAESVAIQPTIGLSFDTPASLAYQHMQRQLHPELKPAKNALIVDAEKKAVEAARTRAGR